MECLPGYFLQQIMYFNHYLYIVWVLCNGLFLYCKMDIVKIPQLLIWTIYILTTITFSLKLYLVQCKHFIFDIRKLTGFMLLTFLMQLPLVSFFMITAESQFFTPVEFNLHGFLILTTFTEGTICFIATLEAAHHVVNQCPQNNLTQSFAEQFPPIGMTRVIETKTKVPRPARICRPRVHTNLLNRHSFRTNICR